MGRHRESLGEFSRRVRHNKGLSRLDVSRQAQQKGERISVTYLAKIESGEARHPSNKILTALAAGLDVLDEEISAIARGESIETPSVKERALIKLFRELPPSTRDDLWEIVKCLRRRHRIKLH